MVMIMAPADGRKEDAETRDKTEHSARPPQATGPHPQTQKLAMALDCTQPYSSKTGRHEADR
jgi:hypothetical protein